MRLLASELVEALETTRGDLAGRHGGADCAPGLGAVQAIPKPAVGCTLFDVRERAADRVARLPQLQLAHPRRVDEHAVSWQHHELASGADVSALAV